MNHLPDQRRISRIHTSWSLITGGSSGIDLARQLLARGNVVTITGRSEPALKAAVDRFADLHAFRSNVNDADGIRALHGTVIARFPELDTLVNSAGVMRIVKLDEDRSLEDVTHEIDIDLAGPIRMVQRLVRAGFCAVPDLAGLFRRQGGNPCLYTTRRHQGDRDRACTAPDDTPLFTTEFKHHVKEAKGIAVDVLVRRSIAAIEAGKIEIRPGQSNILKIAGRLAPDFIFWQMSKVGRS